jgi:hypothetical protein
MRRKKIKWHVLWYGWNGVIFYSNPFCKHCHSHNVTKYDHNVRDLITEYGEPYIAKVQWYYYSDCGNYSQTEFTD